MEGQRNLMDLLSDLKGAPLSILIWFSLNGNRTASASELAGADATGFSDKPIKAGLKKLRELGLITEPRRNRYQLTGREYQLPLYWNEKTEPYGVSPKNIGDSPKYSGVSPDIEDRLIRLENAVFGNTECAAVPLLDIPGRDPEDVPGLERSGSFPEKFGVSPDGCEDGALFDIDGHWSDDCEGGEYSGNIPEKYGVSPDEENTDDREDVTASGVSPEKQGVSPETFGDSPKGLINNINNTQDKEVSKKEGNDTYLLSNMSNEQGLTAAGSVQVSGVRDQMPVEMMHWDAAMVQMKALMDRGTFALMLQEAEVIGYEDGHYTVAVKNAQVRDWVDQRCRETIERILNGMSMNAGVQQSVSFVVHEAVAGGQGSVVMDQLHLAGHAAYHNDQEVEMRPELLPESGDPGEGPLVEICNEYLLDPAGMDYSLEEMAELVAMHPDPRVLRWILPKATKFENAKSWCRCDFVKAKWKVLGKYDIGGPARKEFADNDEVSLELIERWCGEFCPDDPGLAVKRIREFAGKEMEI